MAIPNFVKILPVSILILSCSAEKPIETEAPIMSEPLVAMSAEVPGEAVAEFDDALTAQIEEALLEGSLVTKSAPLNSVLQEMGIVSLERVFPDAGPYEPRTRREGLHRFYHVVYSRGTPVTKALEGLSSVPGVVSASPVRKVRRRTFNDPLFSRQWNMVNKRYAGADINVQSVWNTYTTGSRDVIVNVVDEGVAGDHPDLQANMWNDGSGHWGYNFVKQSYLISTDSGHGTHVAGVIAAVSNNNLGVAGIAGGDAAAGVPGARIMSCAIFQGDETASDYQTAAAIKWGADHGAVLSNNSWGYYADGALDGEEDGYVSKEELAEYKKWSLDAVYKKAINYFITYAGCDNEGKQLPDSPMKGGLVFFAAGNEAIDYDIVSAYEPVISVGAFGMDGGRASYSNYGSYVDIAAPGGNGRTADNSVWSTVPTDVNSSGYAGLYWAGTSMACPHATGVAALLVSYFGGPGFTQEDCRTILLGGLGEVVGGNKPIGKRLDAASVFEYGFEVMAGKNPEEITPPEISLSRESLDVKAHESAMVKVTVKSINKDPVTVSCTPGSDALVFYPDTFTAEIIGRNAPAGTYKAVFEARNSHGLTSSATLEYTLLPNHAPVISSQPEDKILKALNITSTLDVGKVFRDADGETPSLSVMSADPAILKPGLGGENQLTLLPLKSGITSITLKATDALGESASCTFQVAVRLSSAAVEVYPVPASTTVYFWPETKEVTTIKVSVYSAAGALVKTLEGQAGIFAPLAVDITSLAPAKYTAILEYGDTKTKVALVKI